MIGFGGDPGFGVTFSIMRIMVPVIFVLVFGIIIVAMVRGIGEWNKNNRSPKLSVPAKVVSRRTAVSHTIITREMGCIIPIPLPAITPPFR